MLEFALVFPLFIGLVLGIVNMAVVLNNNIVASAAVRDAGRTAIAFGSAEQGRKQGQETLEVGGLGKRQATVSVQDPTRHTETISSEVKYDVPVIAPGFAALLGGNPFDRTVRMSLRTNYYVDEYLRESPPRPPHCGDWYGCR